MSAAERIYGMMMRAYPAAFRAQYGREMALVFRDLHRDAESRGVEFWMAMLGDVARSASAVRMDQWRSQPRRGPMKAMAILAVLVGAVEVGGAFVEANAASWGDARWMTGVVLVIVAGALLLAAGVAMLRRAPSAGTWARGAAIACLVAVALTRVTGPWMSIFSMLIAIVFSIALLVYVQLSGGRRQPVGI